MQQPRVTVICATRNAREAVRLTLSSFRQYTPDPCVVLVADNGSTDGTLDDLRAIPWRTVFSLEERRALMRAEAEQVHDTVSTLNGRLDAYVATLPVSERMLFASIIDSAPESTAGKFLHLGHMSWAGDVTEGFSSTNMLRDDYESRVAYVCERVRLYMAPTAKYRGDRR